MAEDNYHKMKRGPKANVDNNKYKNLNGKGTELLRLKLNNFSTNALYVHYPLNCECHYLVWKLKIY